MTESARGDIVIVITADSSDADRQFENVERRLRGLNDQVERQTRLHQSQNRTLEDARRQQQRLLDIQMRHLRNLTTLNSRQDTFNQRTRASVRDLVAYRNSLLSVADATDRVNNSTRQVRTADLPDVPAATQARRRTRETVGVEISTESIDRAVESVDSLNDGLERTRNFRTIEAPRLANSRELDRSNASLQSYARSLDGVRRAQTGVRTIRTPSVGSPQELDRTNRSLQSYVRNLNDIRRAQTGFETIRTLSVGSPQEIDRTNRSLQAYSRSLDGVRTAQTGFATIQTPRVGTPQGIEQSNRALQSYVRNLDGAGRAQTRFATIRTPRVGTPQGIEQSNRALQSYVRNLNNVSRSSSRGANEQSRFINAIGVGLFRLSSFTRSAALLGTELSIVILVLATVTVALQAMSVVMDLAGVAIIGLAGILTFVYTNAMQRAARSTSLTVQELQVAQQALLGLGFLFEESAMILERAVGALDDARIDPSDEVNAHLGALGVNLSSVENAGRSTLDVIQQILTATEGLSDPARFERLEAIFGDGDVANALVAAGDTFLDRIQRASSEIRVLNRVEIQAVNELGGSVLSIFGTLYSDVRAFFIDNIDAAQTIVRVAEQQLRPLLQGLLDYFGRRIQEFTRDPESFIDGVRNISEIVINVLNTIYRQLQRFASYFTSVASFFNLSATGVASLLVQLVAFSAAFQVLRPLFAILARIVLSFGGLRVALRAIIPIIGSLIGLSAGGAAAGVAGGAAAAGAGLTVAAVLPIVVSVAAAAAVAIGIPYFFRNQIQESSRRDVSDGEGSGRDFRFSQEQLQAPSLNAIANIDRATEAWSLSYTEALDRNAAAQARIEVIQRANELRRIEFEKYVADFRMATAAAEPLGEQVRRLGLTFESVSALAQRILMPTSADDAAAAFREIRELESDSGRVFNDLVEHFRQAIRSLDDFRRISAAAQPLGDHARRLGLTLEGLNELAQRILTPISTDDALAAQEEIRNLEGETGRAFRVIVDFFSETSRFVADQTESTFRSLGEFQEAQARSADTFRSNDEALRVLRQIDEVRIPHARVEGQLRQAELFVALEERYGLSLQELIGTAREYLTVNSNITRESERLRDITLEWTGIALSAIDTLSGALGDIVFRVRTVGEAFRQVFETVIRQAIQALVNTLLNDLIRRINEIRQQAEASSSASALANAVSLVQAGIGVANTAAGGATASQGPVSGTGLVGSGKAAAPASYGDVFQVNAYALGTASPADVERSAREGIIRGYREANDDPFSRAATQRTAEGRN